MTHDKIMAMVRAEIAANPSVKTAHLLAKAKKMDKGVGKLSLRQFYGKYPLQIKREMALSRPRRRTRKRKGSNVDRAAIRILFLQLARTLLEAEGKARVVEVIGGLDELVDHVMAAAGKA